MNDVLRLRLPVFSLLFFHGMNSTLFNNYISRIPQLEVLREVCFDGGKLLLHSSGRKRRRYPDEFTRNDFGNPKVTIKVPYWRTPNDLGHIRSASYPLLCWIGLFNN